MNQFKRKIFLLGLSSLLFSSCGGSKRGYDQALDKGAPHYEEDFSRHEHCNFAVHSCAPLARNHFALKQFETCNVVEEWIENGAFGKISASLKRHVELLKCQQAKSLSPHTVTCEGDAYVSISRSTGIESQSDAGTASTSDALTSPKQAPGVPAETTTTNNQVQGVEEGDLLKSSGSRIFYLSKKKLHILTGWPVADAKLHSSLNIGEELSPLEMYVDNNSLVYIISQKGSPNDPKASRPVPVSQVFDVEEELNVGWLAPNQNPEVLVTAIDASDSANPKVISQKNFRGSYISSRKIGDDLRIVIKDSLNTLSLPVVTFSQVDPSENFDFIESVLESYRKKIQAKDMNFWFRTNDISSISPQFGNCDKVYAPYYATLPEYLNAEAKTERLNARFALTRIVSILDPQNFTESLLLADASGLYASQESLYLTTARWGQESNKLTTAIHKFKWGPAGESLYKGSGQVEGSPINQFAMDEHQDVFRIATTSINNTHPVTSNKVYTLGEKNGILENLGVTAEMAPGERIFSVRFHGDKGFVVTFRRVDPLYTLDLREPTQPKVVGELKIPGFSTYIHMMNDTTLLTIGRGGNGESTAFPKLSVFDVADMANPRELRSYVINSDGKHDYASSDAEANHKAFSFNSTLGVLAIPVHLWSMPEKPNRQATSAITVFDVKSANITELGHVNMLTSPDKGIKAKSSLFMEDYLYSFSDDTLKIRKMDQLGQDVSIINFP